MGYKSVIVIITILTATPSMGQTTFDPATIGVGARSLGMGRAYVAVAEDGDTIFTNPAGLGEIDTFKFTSMSGKILEDASYTMLGGVYPLGNRQALGIGYLAASVSAIDIREADGTYLKRANYENSVVFFSYGKKISEEYSFGLNLKFFSQNGTENDNGDGTGSNLDMGILIKGLDWISFGLVGQNILGTNKVIYKSGKEENISSVVKAGAKMYLLGGKFETARVSPFELTIAADAKLSLRETKPVTTHIGAELSPNRMLTLRAGLDQDPVPGGIQTNLTSGVSLRLAGLGFHYAYHPYTDLSANASHYFSISFDERGWPYEGPPETFLSRK